MGAVSSSSTCPSWPGWREGRARQLEEEARPAEDSSLWREVAESQGRHPMFTIDTWEAGDDLTSMISLRDHDVADCYTR